MKKMVFKFRTAKGSTYSFNISNVNWEFDASKAGDVLKQICTLGMLKDEDGVDLAVQPISVVVVEESTTPIYDESK